MWRLKLGQTDNYTGEQGLIDSPWMPVSLDFRGLAGGHRTPSEQRIIAANTGGSTHISNNFRQSDTTGHAAPVSGAPHRLNSCFFKESGDVDTRKATLADLVYVRGTGRNGVRYPRDFGFGCEIHLLYSLLFRGRPRLGRAPRGLRTPGASGLR